MITEPAPQHLGVVVVGAGFGGLAAARALKRRDEDCAVLEREHEVGGVWRDNTYPGRACDIPSHLYSLSFAPNPGWMHTFSRQPGIRDYLRTVTREHGLLPRIRFGCSLLEAAWDDAAQPWRIETSAGPLTAGGADRRQRPHRRTIHSGAAGPGGFRRRGVPLRPLEPRPAT